ncbi:LysR family transcriptional regulator [Pseudoalteromonas fuliginea]|uniref:LysR family transcriptional regulator n=1 Tax=Pseudoalteromonas fuliginea TaxID=1872678 RepID=A0ABQ6RHM2_9GAMM|nr:LysR family transcriptional regulator [Pseudoalteromonas fuliginea]KAA1155968.1 LysR family transcriptional regulator [Pseudoalteromonas fuliginea]KAA1167207.1 LysR family transcriptional regulator [Pseudoalteromonas fuliginea]
MNTNKLLPFLYEMAIFVKVVELGSFSSAAQNIGVSPSSISRAVSRLEGFLNEKLLERTTRNMRLTSTGQEVFMLCRDMLESAKMAVSAAQSDQNNVAGSLIVAAPKALSKQVLMPMILDFIQKYPNVTFQLKVTDIMIDPIGDEVDVLIHLTNKPIEGLIAKRIGECRLILCASTGYVEKFGKPIHPDDLAQHNCLCLGENPIDQVWKFTNNTQKVVVNVSGSFVVNHSEIRRAAVLNGTGISVFPDFVILRDIESNEAVELLPDWHVSGSYQGEILAQYAQSKYIPNQIKVFVKYMQDYFNVESPNNIE